jgi:Fe2+ or Zn2+ uptake regulation protein
MAELGDPGALRMLREASVRPTVARIGILQLLKSCSPMALGAEEILRRMLQRGLYTTLGTVYHSIRILEGRGLLVCETADAGKRTYALYQASQARIQLVCGHTGRCVALEDAGLSSRIAALARSHGLQGPSVLVNARVAP